MRLEGRKVALDKVKEMSYIDSMELKNLISVQEAAELLGVTRARVDQIIKDGRLEVVHKLAQRRLLDRKQVERFKELREG